MSAALAVFNMLRTRFRVKAYRVDQETPVTPTVPRKASTTLLTGYAAVIAATISVTAQAETGSHLCYGVVTVRQSVTPHY